MFLNELVIIGDITEYGFCGGGVVTTLGQQLLFFAIGFVVLIYQKLGNITSYIVNGYRIKGVYSFEPIGIELKHTLVKLGVVGVSVFDFKLYNITIHSLTYIAPLVKGSGFASHTADVNITLVSVIGGGEKHRVVPYLFYDIITSK
jgi:hypothetical protein